MAMETIRELYWHEPFEPFVLRLDDGREIPVHGREWIALSPTGKSVFVTQPTGDDDLVRLGHIREVAPMSMNAAA